MCVAHVHLPPCPQVFGFLYSEYRDELYYWGSVAQAQTFTLVAVQVFSMVLAGKGWLPPACHAAQLLLRRALCRSNRDIPNQTLLLF